MKPPIDIKKRIALNAATYREDVLVATQTRGTSQRTYPLGAVKQRIYTQLHNDLDSPEAQRTHYTNHSIHHYASAGNSV